ncbi:MAG: hypothetical protein EU529_09890 [Promethearchaeota archaeon]|nr:MAG: hypothetical protein EU529_09890 [Candidatus Lokiarchaeota archaeon]
MIQTKTCCHCKLEFPATNDFFTRNRSKKDGLSTDCKECKKKYDETGKRGRIINLKKALFRYFLLKFCEFGEYTIRSKVFYDRVLHFFKSYSVTMGKLYIYHLMNEIENIKMDSKKIQGIRFNKKAIKLFGISNVCNIDVNIKELNSKNACIEKSCKIGQTRFRQIYDKLEDSKKNRIKFDDTLQCYKDIESFLYKIHKPRRFTVKIGVAIYLTNKLNQKESKIIAGCSDTAITETCKLLKIRKKEYQQKKGFV